jgi:hypothetical protein
MKTPFTIATCSSTNGDDTLVLSRSTNVAVDHRLHR